MKNSKLLTLLEHLTVEELKRLDLYLQSPFFIEEKKKELHKRAHKLFLYLNNLKKSFVELTKDELFNHIYSTETFKLIKINQLMAYLVKKIEQFIIYTRRNSRSYVNDVQQKQILLDFYIEKNLNKWYEAEKRAIQKLQTQTTLRDNTFFLQQFWAECRYAKLASAQSNRKEKTSLKTMIYALQSFYMLTLLDIGCLIKRSFVFNDEDLQLIENNIACLEMGTGELTPTIDVYVSALQLIGGEKNDETYEKYKKLLADCYVCFLPNEAKNLLTYALNYCLIQINKGREEYYEECWDLYRLGVTNKILYVDKKIMPPDLKNIITLSSRLKKYEWAEDFLHQHKNKIQATNPKEVYSFNLANVFFYQQKYAEVHQILASLKCKDIFYDLGMRRLEIKVFYEQEEIELLYSKLNAYRVFVHRNQVIGKESKERNNNFLNLVGKLIKTIPRDKKQLEILEKELQKTPKLAERKWIVAKLEELKK